MVIKVCLAGATGWAGSELARSIAKAADLALVAGVSRKHAGRALGEVLGEPRLTCPVYSSAKEALANPCEVFVEYTKPDSAKTNILAALEHGAHVVVGTSGLTEKDYAEIDLVARAGHRGVLACGNFALTVVLLMRFAETAAFRSGRSSTTRTTTRSTHRAELPANSQPACPKCAIPSPRSRWIAPWDYGKPGAPRSRRPRFTPFVCPAT